MSEQSGIGEVEDQVQTKLARLACVRPTSLKDVE